MEITQVKEAGDLAAAVALGWRVAELYSLVDDPVECSGDTLLPAHGSLARADHLELQLRAAAGEAKRAGVTAKSASPTALIHIARETAEAEHLQETFRERLRDCHMEIAKDLWSIGEALGKAYELGNGLSDTYGLVCRAYRDPDGDREASWLHVFSDGRIERVKKLLDDLQSRLDPTAVTVVCEQLNLWRDEVPARLNARGLPDLEHVRDGLRRQTVIWRQLIAGDKRPEAYLGAEERARVRDTLRDLAWKRYRLWVPVVAVVLAALVFALPHLADWYRESVVPSGLASIVVTAIGALGITRASLLMTVRSRLHEWADLLWQRAVVTEVAQSTLAVDDVFCRPHEREHPRIVAVTVRTAARFRGPVRPAHESKAG